MMPHASAPNESTRPRRTLILSYPAADAFAIYVEGMTVNQEVHGRLVRGQRATAARFTMASFPIPHYPKQTKSLYELQELSRAGVSRAQGERPRATVGSLLVCSAISADLGGTPWRAHTQLWSDDNSFIERDA
jgi:hypothetical protein